MPELEGIVEGTVFRNEENGYSVLELRVKKEQVIAVGILPALGQGEQVSLPGEWATHPVYGRQWKATGCRIAPPSTLKGIEGFLSSGLIKGVGKDTAGRLVRFFGKDVLEVLEHAPEKLTQVPGIGPKRAMGIAQSFREQYGLRQAMIYLQGFSLPPALSVRIARHYGDRTEIVLRQNPYRLVEEIDGIGFLTADAIARSVGMPEDSIFRYRAALKYVLQEAAAGNGHTFLPRALLLREAARLLRCEPEALEEALNRLLLDRELVLTQTQDEPEGCMLSGYYYAEKETAQRLLRLAGSARTVPVSDAEANRAVDRYERSTGVCLSAMQREAACRAARSGALIITGGPGTGKTTIIRCILSMMGDSVLLAAPTGRAAKRMSEACGRSARTLHRLLEYNGEMGGFQKNEDSPLKCDCLIIDEMSMVDIFLMRAVLRALREGTRLILVGDSDQLPSVGAGNVLGDLLESKALPAVRLTDIFRQASGSMIVTNAHRINQGQLPVVNQKEGDFFMTRCAGADRAAEEIVTLCAQRLPRYLRGKGQPEDIQVLSPTKKGQCGVQVLNPRLQEALNPPRKGKKEFRFGETLFREGDRVMHIRNDYELEWADEQTGRSGKGVFNGDMGVISRIDPEDASVLVRYEESRLVEYTPAVLDELELAYCVSVHKSQGSEFEAVVMPVTGGPPMLLTRNLLYTAVTRARGLLVLVGNDDTLAAMVRNDHIVRRFTALKERIRECV